VRALVIDASVAVKWAVPEPLTNEAKTLLDGGEMCAPAHWQAEAVNAVWKRAHRGQLSVEDAKECASVLVAAPVTPVPLVGLLEPAMDLAVKLRISIYDSLYVALAAERQIPLVSDDRELMRRMMAEPIFARLALPLDRLPGSG
jgi:predicted nucleic acid-binding protein